MAKQPARSEALYHMKRQLIASKRKNSEIQWHSWIVERDGKSFSSTIRTISSEGSMRLEKRRSEHYMYMLSRKFTTIYFVCMNSEFPTKLEASQVNFEFRCGCASYYHQDWNYMVPKKKKQYPGFALILWFSTECKMLAMTEHGLSTNCQILCWKSIFF